MRTTRVILLAAAALLAVAGMGFATGEAEQGTAEDRLAAVGFNATGLPVVDQQITVRAVISRPGHIPVPYDTMTLLIDLQEMTNIDIEFEELPAAQANERVNLMFASREFPDVFFDAGIGGNDALIYDAALGGDVWQLDPLIERYAPNWKRAFEEDERLRLRSAYPDGHIYSLPYTRNIVHDYAIRDEHAINVDWMRQLGLEMPETTEEFYQVLKAFRQGIDDGTLPAQGAPWYFRFHQWVGGEFDVYGAFGVWIKDASYLSVNDGTVEFGALDPKLVDVIEYMHRLFSEGLIPEEVFTDDWDTYLSKIRSTTPITGSFGAYFITQALEDYYDPLMPLRAPGVDQPLFRSQPVRVEKNQFTMMTKFEYPEAMMRLIDYTADALWALQLSFGRLGENIFEQADGTYVAEGISSRYLQHAPHNFLPAYISSDISDKVVWQGDRGLREEYARAYLPFVWPQDRHFIPATYTDEELEKVSVLETEMRNYVSTTLAGWIVNGGARDEWDAYIEQLNRLGLEELMGIYQAASDRFLGT